MSYKAYSAARATLTSYHGRLRWKTENDVRSYQYVEYLVYWIEIDPISAVDDAMPVVVGPGTEVITDPVVYVFNSVTGLAAPRTFSGTWYLDDARFEFQEGGPCRLTISRSYTDGTWTPVS